MKKIVFILGSLFLSVISIADDKNVESKISEVTVFLQGAQITRTSDLVLPKGVSEITFVKLSANLDAGSLQVTAPEKAKILSVTYRLNDHKEVSNETEIKILHKLRDDKNFEMQKLNKLLKVYESEEGLLMGNTKFSGSESGVNLEELKQAADFFRKKLEEISLAKLEIEKQKTDLQEDINELNKKITESASIRPEPSGEVIVKIEVQSPATISVKISYFVLNAGWTPDYDIRVSKVDEPISLTVKANVTQKTGEDWKDIMLTLSTNNPRKGNNKPEMSPWYLGYYQPKYSYQPDYNSYGTGTIKGKVVDAQTREPIPFANVIIESDNYQKGGATTDFNGNYIIKPVPPGYYNLKVMYVGYNTSLTRGLVVNPDKIRFYDINLVQSENALEEIVITDYKIPLINKDETVSGGYVTGEEIKKMPNRSADYIASNLHGVYTEENNSRNIRGARSDEEILYIDGIKIESSDYIPHSSVQTPTNISYKVDVPYSVPSDGESYTVRITDYKLPTDYEYYCAPKFDNDVFLIARITDWSELNILSGNSSIYFEGTYTGSSFLNTMNTEDTLKISVGRDNNIIVQREQIKDVNSTQYIGTNKKVSRGYEIKIRNNKNVPIKLVLEDQLPVSQNKEIDVENIDISDAKYEEKSGKLTWNIELKPQENFKKEFRYAMKFPKDKTVILY